MTYQFGHQCDALTASGKRCTRRNRWAIPCLVASTGPTVNDKQTYGREVHLCHQHCLMQMRKHEKDRQYRLPLIEGGYLGGWNRFGYGNMVLAQPKLEWDEEGKLIGKATIPKYWAKPEESPWR